jgi:aryl-alcohol dehydrogenase-like predicted oxidoreductase
MRYLPDADRYSRIDYRRSGRSGIKLPEISLGLWQNFGHSRPIEVSREIVLRAIGVSSIAQLEENRAALEHGELSSRELEEIDRALSS